MRFCLVVPRSYAFPTIAKEGFFLPDEAPESLADVIDEHAFYAEREIMEQRAAFLQVIPTVCVAEKAEDGFDLLIFLRSKSAGEARLHDKFSLIFGGHIDPGDFTKYKGEGGTRNYIFPVLERCAWREIAEELSIGRSNTAIKLLGYLNVSGDAVSQVHLGVVHVCTTSNENFLSAVSPCDDEVVELLRVNVRRSDANDPISLTDGQRFTPVPGQDKVGYVLTLCAWQTPQSIDRGIPDDTAKSVFSRLDRWTDALFSSWAFLSEVEDEVTA